MKKKILGAVIGTASLIAAGAVPELTVSCDGTAEGIDRSGKSVPAQTAQLEFVPGLSGQAIRFKPGSKLIFEQPGLLGDSGAVSMWVRADWNGWEETSLNRFLLAALNADGKQLFPFWFWSWLRFDLPRDDGSAQSVDFSDADDRLIGLKQGPLIHITISGVARSSGPIGEDAGILQFDGGIGEGGFGAFDFGAFHGDGGFLREQGGLG